MNEYVCIAPSVKLGRDVKLSKFINLYGCQIGDVAGATIERDDLERLVAHASASRQRVVPMQFLDEMATEQPARAKHHDAPALRRRHAA